MTESRQSTEKYKFMQRLKPFGILGITLLGISTLFACGKTNKGLTLHDHSIGHLKGGPQNRIVELPDGTLERYNEIVHGSGVNNFREVGDLINGKPHTHPNCGL